MTLINSNRTLRPEVYPVFMLTPREFTGNLTGDVKKQKQIVNNAFVEIMQFSEENKYESIRERYPAPVVRNPLVEILTKLTNSFGNSPVHIVELSGRNTPPKPIYSIRKITPERKSKLITPIIESDTNVREDIVYGKLQQITKGNKKPRVKALEIYSDQSVSLSHTWEKIEFDGKKYLLHFPLRCLLEKEDKTYLIKSEMLDLVGTGETEMEAEESFAREFDFIYNRYNGLDDSRLSPRLRRIKNTLNHLVKSVEKLWLYLMQRKLTKTF